MKKTKTKRTKFLIALILVLVIGGLLLYSAERGVHFWLNKQLPELLNQNPNRKYDISFSHAELSIRKKKLVLEEISIVPSKIDSTIRSTAIVKQFNIEQPDLKSLFYHKEIVTSKLVVFEPQITIYTQTDSTNQSKKEINELWKDVFTRLSISNFEIVDASLKVWIKDTIEPKFSFEKMDLKVVDFQIDTSTIKDPFPVSFSKIVANCQNIQVKIDTISKLKIESVYLTNTDASIFKIELLPVLISDQFLEVKRAKNDWLQIYIDRVDLNNFTWDLKTENSQFYASSLFLDSIDLHALTDLSFPKQNNGYKPLLSEMLRNLPFTFALDSFVVTNSNVLFETIPISKKGVSSISFNGLYTSGYNFHNTSEKEIRTEFDILASFMNETRIEASYRMNVNDPFNRFQVTGKMDDMSTTTLNNILQPLAGVEAVGEIYGVDFNILGNNFHSTGTLNFEYEGLKVKILDTETSEKNIFLSAISNIALRKSNVLTDKRFRQGVIDLDRDVNKSILGFLWESIKDGMMDTLVPFELEKLQKSQKEEKKRPFRLFKKRKKIS